MSSTRNMTRSSMNYVAVYGCSLATKRTSATRKPSTRSASIVDMEERMMRSKLALAQLRLLQCSNGPFGSCCDRDQKTGPTFESRHQHTTTSSNPDPSPSLLVIVRHAGPLSSVFHHKEGGQRKTIYFRPFN